MKTSKEIAIEKCFKYNDCLLPGQLKWIIEAMEEYAEIKNQKQCKCNGVISYEKLSDSFKKSIDKI